jgi:hypothetical protein
MSNKRYINWSKLWRWYMKTMYYLHVVNWNKSTYRWVYENPLCKWGFTIFPKLLVPKFGCFLWITNFDFKLLTSSSPLCTTIILPHKITFVTTSYIICFYIFWKKSHCTSIIWFEFIPESTPSLFKLALHFSAMFDYSSYNVFKNYHIFCYDLIYH